MDRIFLDLPDSIVRRIAGRSDRPPYSLRAFVGGAKNFDEIGDWFRQDFWRLGLFGRGSRILDIGCGCGRIAYPLARDPKLAELEVRYTGMDVDRPSIEWCGRHIGGLNPRFTFYHVDWHNPSYNPAGAGTAERPVFPHAEASFDLIILTSVFTHLLEEEFRHYLAELSRLLAPGGCAYASFFLVPALADAVAGTERHGIRFPVIRDRCAINRVDFPANAVAYEEPFVREVAAAAGLTVAEPVHYGQQDVVLFCKTAEGSDAVLADGWHEPDSDCWRWTDQSFAVRLRRPSTERLTLRFRFSIPEAVFDRVGPVRLRATANEIPLTEREYIASGEHLYVETFALSDDESVVTIRFVLDKAYGPTAEDGRRLGVQVVFAVLSDSHRRPAFPFVLT